MSEQGSEYFYHRPFSVRITGVRKLDIVRDSPATETLLLSNQRFDRKSAREMVDLLLPFLLDNTPGIDYVDVTTTGIVP